MGADFPAEGADIVISADIGRPATGFDGFFGIVWHSIIGEVVAGGIGGEDGIESAFVAEKRIADTARIDDLFPAEITAHGGMEMSDAN